MATHSNESIPIVTEYHGRWKVCVKHRNIGSFGIFFGDRPFDFVLPVTLCQLFSHILISRAIHFLLRPIRTPKFICSLLGGILLGPTLMGNNKMYMETLFPARQAEYLVMITYMCSAILLFFFTLKMDLAITLRAAKSMWRLGVLPVMVSFSVMTVLLTRYYNPPNVPHFKLQASRGTISATMAFGNFPVVSDALIELNLIATELGQIALSSSMINDHILWVFIVVNRMASYKEVTYAITFLICLLLYLAVNVFIIRPILQLIGRNTPVGQPVKEVYVVSILVGVLVMIAVADVIGITYLLGALLFGLTVPSGPPVGTAIVEKCEFIVTEFLLPFFYVYIGINTNLAALDWQMFFVLQGIFMAGYLAKILVCVLVCLTYNIKPKHGMVLGFMLNIKGLTELVALVRLMKIGMLDEEMFSQMVFCVVFTTMIVTPVIKLLYKHRPRVLHASSLLEGHVRTVQGTPRKTEFRVICCIHNEENVLGMTTLLEVLNPMIESPMCLYVIHLTELTGKSSSIFLPLNYKHNRKFLSINYPNTNHIMRAFENFSRNSSGPVTVIPYVNVAPYKSMHDAICNLAQDKMIPLIIIPFHENDHVGLAGHVTTSIRKMNTVFQDCAPCTLGLLVDRYSKLGVCNNTNQDFNVGIFFIGGADDREALTLGIRMSEQENTSVSLFRFVVLNTRDSEHQLSGAERQEEEEDMLLDEGLIDEFRGKKYGNTNAQVSSYEIIVEDVIGVLDAIHGLEGNYNLVMVGMRHNIQSVNDQEMANFLENAETLGIFGDLLSSTEFCLGMVPVLVTQCGGKLMQTKKFDRLVSDNVFQKTSNVK